MSDSKCSSIRSPQPPKVSELASHRPSVAWEASALLPPRSGDPAPSLGEGSSDPAQRVNVVKTHPLRTARILTFPICRAGACLRSLKTYRQRSFQPPRMGRIEARPPCPPPQRKTRSERKREGRSPRHRMKHAPVGDHFDANERVYPVPPDWDWAEEDEQDEEQ